jgi:hypothetical protein
VKSAGCREYKASSSASSSGTTASGLGTAAL